MKTNKIILASGSPRRKELFDKYGLDYIVDYVETNEVLDKNLTLSKQLEHIALQKALPLKNKYPNHMIIAGDTMVTFQQQMLGKPKNRQDAKRMLKQLSGNQQLVITAVAIIDKDKEITFSDGTIVEFKEISDQEIEQYLDTNEWHDKAGAYAIQGIAKKFVSKIQGDMETVIGLPMRLIMNYLNNGQID